MTKSKSKSKKSDKGKEINNPSNAGDSRVSECIKFYYEFTEASSLEGRHFGCDSRSGEGTHVLCSINS